MQGHIARRGDHLLPINSLDVLCVSNYIGIRSRNRSMLCRLKGLQNEANHKKISNKISFASCRKYIPSGEMRFC